MIEAQRRVRQSAIRMLAQEYSDASLTEMGVGEYDPSFVVTKLGARVNRALVAGVIDRMEREETVTVDQVTPVISGTQLATTYSISPHSKTRCMPRPKSYLLGLSLEIDF